MRRRRKGDDDTDGGANWMDTYGDLVTLLLAFFVMLFAASSVNEAKWSSIVESFTGYPPGELDQPIDTIDPAAFYAPPIEEEVPEEPETPEEPSQEQLDLESRFNTLYESIKEYISDHDQQESLLLSKDGMFISLTIAEGILFDSGQATIRDEVSEQVLTDIGEMLLFHLDDIQNITIEGHTDNRPISTAVFEDNLDLSNKRASNVARFISATTGIEMDMFLSLGRSEWEPIASNDTEEGRRKNRRVNIVILAKDLGSTEEMEIGKIIQAIENTTAN